MQKDKINIIVVGDKAVGKTAFVYRYTTGTYEEKDHVSTLGVDLQRKHTEFGQVNMWDTVGQEKFRSLSE